MIISFAGHSSISWKSKVKDLVKKQIENNITSEEHIICYLGGYGDFDEICAIACSELKNKYNNTFELIYVTPYITLSEKAKIKEMEKCGFCDATVYPPLENVPLRVAISKRNEWMMKNADVVIAYVNRNHGGAFKALQVAKQNEKKVINVFHFL